VKEGTTVALPNDPTNQARALVLLEQLGWIKLRDRFDPIRASEKDIAANLKKIKLMPLEAAQLPRSLQDTDYSFVNGNLRAGLGPEADRCAAHAKRSRPTTSTWWRCAPPTRTSSSPRTSPRPTARGQGAPQERTTAARGQQQQQAGAHDGPVLARQVGPLVVGLAGLVDPGCRVVRVHADPCTVMR
jgi:hypothetical protein